MEWRQVVIVGSVEDSLYNVDLRARFFLVLLLLAVWCRRDVLEQREPCKLDHYLLLTQLVAMMAKRLRDVLWQDGQGDAQEHQL